MRKRWLPLAMSLCMALSPTIQAVAGTADASAFKLTEESAAMLQKFSEQAIPLASTSNAQKTTARKEKRSKSTEQGTFHITEDFEGEDLEKWGMDGNYLSSVKLVKEEDGNTYLGTTRDKEVKNAEAKKIFSVSERMNQASMSFQYRVDELKSDASRGCGGFTVYSGEREVVSLYFYDMRTLKDTPELYYSVGGSGSERFDKTKSTGITLTGGEWHTVDITCDFTTSRMTVTWDGAEIVSEEIEGTIQYIDTFSFIAGANGKKTRLNSGIDDFSLEWEENTEIDENATKIESMTELKDVTVSKKEWENGYQHPKSVEVMLRNGEKVEVDIDKDTWSSAPVFDVDEANVYAWTAKLATSSNANPKNLEASYKMNYLALVEHDYYNDFTLDTDIWEKLDLSSKIDSKNGTGTLTLSRKTEENGNSYLHAERLDTTGHRGHRVLLTDESLKGADVCFDWMPVEAGEKGCGEIMLFSKANWNSYFTIRFDKDFNLSAYTKCSLEHSSTVQPEFDGAVSAEDAILTGMGGQNKWFHVQIHLDYVEHTADLKVTERDNPDNEFVQTGIPIDTTANGLSVLLLNKDKDKVAMGLDNLAIDYERFGSNDIVEVEQLEDVRVAKTAYDTFVWPKEIQVEMGDGSKKTVGVGEWTSEPVFDREKEGDYIWTAELVLEDGMTNHLKKAASFKMGYSMKPYPLVAQNPNALELEFGEALPELPTEVMVSVSDGTMDKMPVEEWIPIRAFDAQTEGVYVWGAKLKETEKYQIVEAELRKNEFHDSERTKFPTEESPEKYIYDVYYRVNYFKTNNNYNGYTRSMENLERGVYAIQSRTEGIFVSWRLLATEYGEDVQFNVYRNGILVNDEPIVDKTNYVDEEGKPGDVYTVETLKNGQKYTADSYTATTENYLNIDVQKPDPQPSANGSLATYSLNDAGVADVDGDGRYEIIVKWYPSNGFDSGKQNGPSSPTIFDVYRMDGTPLWRLNMGLEMPSGAHFNQFIFYDMDEDGKAELFIKTSDGTTTYRPNAEGKFDMSDPDTQIAYVGDPNVVPGSNIICIKKGSGKNGHVDPESNEYVTVFNGLTGEIIDSVDFANPTENFEQWGDTYGNRSARYNTAIGYLPKSEGSTETIPAAMINRGYYQRTTVAAYTLRDGKLNLEWNFVAPKATQYAGKGNHNMSTGDMDNDGFDELVIGALAIDHDGTALWAKDGIDGRDLSGHADAIHLSAMSPESDQLYVCTPSEEDFSTLNYSITNAANGGRIAGVWTQCADIGRGIAANITPMPGFEYWASVPNSEIPDQIPSGAIYNFYGEIVSKVKPRNFTTNWRMYWDGDLLSELPDAKNPSQKAATAAVHKYNWETNTMDTMEVFTGTLTNNSSKNTPCLTADLFGDWREEIMLRTSDDSALRIYFTNYETEYMIYTLMHDPVYRNAVANQNTAYNQPPHAGFYLGEDDRDRVLNMELPVPVIQYTTPDQEGQPIESDKPNLTELNAAVESAEALTESEYTAESWKAVAEALEAAKALLAAEEVSQKEADDAAAKLKAAVEALEKKPEEPIKPEEPTKPNLTELNAAVESAEALTESEYTAESWKAVAEALEAAKALLAAEEVSQKEADDAAAKLKAAVEALEKKPEEPIKPEEPTKPTKPAEPDTSNDSDSSDNETKVVIKNTKSDTESMEGQWVRNDTGWWLRFEDGTWPVSKWLYLEWNGKQSWYYFNAAGYMQTGWLTYGKDRYYLHPISDGTMGYMYTGWKLIEGKWYYFNPVSDGSMGRLLVNATTPDGYRVDENGVWIP